MFRSKLSTSESERGFSLVELLITVLVVGVVIGGLMGMFITASKVNASAGDLTECTALAQDQMERLKQADYDSLPVGGSLVTPATGFNRYVDADQDGRNDYLLLWSSSAAGALSSAKPLSSGGIGVHSINVRCRTLRNDNSQSGKPKEVTFSTYKSKGVL